MACQSCKEKQLAQQQKALQSLQSKGLGVVHFDSDPSGAIIYVDGQLLTNYYTGETIRTPSAVPLLEGRRDFTFILQGYNTVSGYVDVFPNTTVNIYRKMG